MGACEDPPAGRTERENQPGRLIYRSCQTAAVTSPAKRESMGHGAWSMLGAKRLVPRSGRARGMGHGACWERSD